MLSYNIMVRSAPDNFQVCSPVTARPGGLPLSFHLLHRST